MREIMVDQSRCNGCLTCTLACAAAHSRSGSITGAMAEGITPRIFIQAAGALAVPVLCRHCQEPACVEACMTGAMQKDPPDGAGDQRGPRTVLCGLLDVPHGLPLRSHRPESEPVKRAVKCDRCPVRDTPACVEACPNGALSLVEPEEFAEARRRETARVQAAAAQALGR